MRMLAIKRYFIGRKRRNSVESLPDTGVTCTCAANKGGNRGGGRRRRDVSPTPSLGGLFGGRSTVWNGGPGQESPPPGTSRRDAYRRSISLGQILQGGDPNGAHSAGVGGGGGYRGTLTSAGSSDASPDSQTDARELTEFEKENLLFLKDLDNSYHHHQEEPIYAQPYEGSYGGHHQPCQHTAYQHRPLSQSVSNTSLVSAYSDDSITGESTPRGGSPFPGGRRHNLYSPSRAQSSYLIRSVSREEDCLPLEEAEEERTHPAYRSERQPGARTRTAASAIPVPMAATSFMPCSGESSAPSSVSSWASGAPPWWGGPHYPPQVTAPPPPRMRPNTPPSPTPHHLLHNSDFGSPSHILHPPQHPQPSSTTSPRIRPPTPPSPPPQRIRPPASPSPPPMPRIRSPSPPPLLSPPAPTPSQIPRSLFSMRTSSSTLTNGPVSTASTSGIPTPRTLRGFSSSYGGGPSTSSGAGRTSRIPSFGERNSEDISWRPSRQTSFSTVQEHFSEESPRKDSDPETPAEPPFGLGASAGATSLSVASGLDSEALAGTEASSSGARGASDPEAEAGAVSGDGASSTGSEGRRAATAFTIELEKEDDGEGSAKKLDIGGPLAKWAPKHRRNLSLTKVEENKKVDERGGGKPPVYRARSGTVGGASSPAAQGGLPRKPGGYHSEGYFSSDQDEDAPRKTDMRSPRSPRPPEVKSPLVGGAVGLPNGVSRSASQDFHRHSPTLRKTSVGTRPGDSARACCKGLEKKPSVADITGRSSRSSSDKGSKASTKIDSKKLESGSTHTNCQPFKVDRLADDSTRDEDEVSEAGTYTIDKDSSPELERARGDIERVFGLASATVEVDGNPYSPAVPPPPLWDSQPGPDTYKTSPSISRNSPNWIQQWAAQVAEQTNAGDLSDPSKPGDSSLTSKSSLVSPRGSKMSMLPSVSGSQDSSDMLRPRRKLPTPPSLLQQSYPPGVSRAPDLDELEIMAKTRARVTDNTPITSSGGYRIASFESHDSGGDSDLDTSTSYAALHDDRPPAALRAKLKLSGLDSNSEKGLGGSSPRASNKHESSNSSHIKRERSNMSDGGLRRARLATDDTPSSSRQPPLTPTERRKQQQQQQQQPVIRTSSSGGPLGVRRSPASRVGGLPSPDIRSPSSNTHQAVVKSPSRSSITKKEHSGLQRKHPGSRSNSTMSSKEVDFQNWKRRKNYDPMKAAMDGRKKQLEKKDPDKNMSGNVTSSDRGSPSPPGSLLRSASFHGTDGMMGGRWPRPTLGRYPHHSHNTYTSEDDGPVSYDDEQLVPAAPHASPLRRSPASPPHQGSGSPGHGAARGRRSSYAHSDDSEHLTSSPSRKISLDETGSEGKRSPLSVGGGGASSSASAAGGTRCAGPGQGGSSRSRAKIEALDNLVISTIHSLSVKVRGTSENLLQKLKAQYSGEDRDRAELLQNVLNHLNSESESATSQIRSTSRDLSGILKNLKKIQTALEVIDQVMVVSGGDYDDLDDVDWPNNVGSDY